MNKNEVPYLEDWITPGLAATVLGVSKQAVHTMISDGVFSSLHRVQSNGVRPMFVMKHAEVVKLKEKRDAAKRLTQVNKKATLEESGQ